MIKKLIYSSLACAMILLCNCETNPNEIILTDPVVELNAIRIDKLLYDNHTAKEVHNKLVKYPELYENFFTIMLRAGNKEDLFSNQERVDSFTIPTLDLFINDTNMQYVFQSIAEEFPDFNFYEKEISKGFARTQQLFNSNKSIKIGTFYSNFNATVLESDDIIWIGLDMYLGKDHPVVDLLPTSKIPQFYKDKMDKKYILSDVFFGYLMSHAYEPIGNDFLSRSLAYGKIAYIMTLILPDDAEENKFRYSKEELDWCITNEKSIWHFIIDNELLYSKDASKTDVFFSDGPYTKSLGKDSPSGVGIWLGYQIIADYARKTNQTAIEILNEKNIQKLLNTYEPE